jgi:hypothetical protein
MGLDPAQAGLKAAWVAPKQAFVGKLGAVCAAFRSAGAAKIAGRTHRPIGWFAYDKTAGN